MPTATRNRRTIGEDPLDALLSAPRNGRPAKPSRPRAIPKTRATYHLPDDVVQAARDAAVALSGPPTRLTLSALVESALRREVARLQAAHNRGRAFPLADEPLRGGRPLGRGDRGPTAAQEATAADVTQILATALHAPRRGRR